MFLPLKECSVKNNIRIPSKFRDVELVQTSAMKQHFPGFKATRNEAGNLVFIGSLQPDENIPLYTISIEYRKNKMPNVTVLKPSLVEKPPHVYPGPEKHLCLYKPSNFNWSAGLPLSNYIVTWTACWIYFYEVWKECGKWLGPEAVHDTNKEKSE
jgi:hypothetical protein